jgi:hypothetical protein
MLRKFYNKLFKNEVTDPIVFNNTRIATDHLLSLVKATYREFGEINEDITHLISMCKITKEKLNQAEFRSTLAQNYPTLMKLILERKRLKNELAQMSYNWVIATKKNEGKVESFCITYLDFNNNKIELHEKTIPLDKEYDSFYAHLSSILINHDNPLSIERLLRPSMNTCSDEHRYSFLNLQKCTKILADTSTQEQARLNMKAQITAQITAQPNVFYQPPYNQRMAAQRSADYKEDKAQAEARRAMEEDLEMIKNILNPPAPAKSDAKESARDTPIPPARLSTSKSTLYATSKLKPLTDEEVAPTAAVPKAFEF